MLTAKRGPAGRVLRIYREEDCLRIQTDRGELRVEPKRADVFRIRFAPGALARRTGIGILRDEPFGGWRYEEGADEVVLTTEKAALHIDRQNGAIRYCGAGGELFLAETKREAEPFEAYPPSSREGEQWEEVPTPDGVKRRLARKSDRPARTLFHTWLHFAFQEGEAL